MKISELEVPFGWGARNYFQSLFLRHKGRFTESQFNWLWELQGEKCAECKAQLAHPVRREIDRFGRKLNVTQENPPRLVCVLCNRPGARRKGEQNARP